MTKSVAIVGNSSLAGTIAFALLQNAICNHIVLVDHDQQALPLYTDLDDCTYMNDTQIHYGDWKLAGQADVIIFAYDSISVFPPEEPTVSNVKFLKACKLAIDKTKPYFTSDTILLVANYPSDVFTKFIHYWSGLDSSKVFGIGTMLDTMRLKRLLSEDYQVPPSSIPLFVYGVERENTLVTWLAPPDQRGGKPLFQKINIDHAHMYAMRKGTEFEKNLKNKEPFFATAAIVFTLVKTILFNERRLHTVTFYQKDLDIAISFPALVSAQGVIRYPTFHLTDDEETIMKSEVVRIKESVNQYKNELMNG